MNQRQLPDMNQSRYDPINDEIELIIYPSPKQIETFKEQAQQYQSLQNNLNIDNLELVYIISLRWLQRWKIYISYEEFINDIPPSKYLGGPNLWKINEDLIQDFKALFQYYPTATNKLNVWLKPHLKLNEHFIYVDRDIWNLLKQSTQGIQITRNTYMSGIHKQVELHLQKVNIGIINQSITGNIKCDRISKIFSGFLQISNQDSLQEWINCLEKTVKIFKQYDFEPGCIQLWQLKNANSGTPEELYTQIKRQLIGQNNTKTFSIYLPNMILLCPTKFSSLSDCGISDDDFIMIDAKEKNNSYVITNQEQPKQGRCSWCSQVTVLPLQCECANASYCKDTCQMSDLQFHIKQCTIASMKYELSVNQGVRKPDSIDGRCGLNNLGNTCFMNSGLQCLSNSVGLTEYFLQNIYQNDINLNNILGSQGELASAFALLLKHLWYSKDKSYAPVQFKKLLAKYYTMFSGFLQHDSSEFLMFLLDGLHEDLNLVKNKPQVVWTDSNGRDELAVAIEHWECHHLRNESIVVDFFFAQLKSEVNCLKCDYTSTKYEPYLTIQLPLISQKNKPNGHLLNGEETKEQELVLEDCFEFYQECITLDQDNLWFCPQCKVHVQATQTLKLYSAPQYMILHLKRFGDVKHIAKTKLDTFVRYPLELDMSNYVINKGLPREYVEGNIKEYQGLKYELYAVINHFGGMYGGHYTSFAKNKYDGKFYHYDDSQVYEVQNVITTNAYVLFYQRKEL